MARIKLVEDADESRVVVETLERGEQVERTIFDSVAPEDAVFFLRGIAWAKDNLGTLYSAQVERP